MMGDDDDSESESEDEEPRKARTNSAAPAAPGVDPEGFGASGFGASGFGATGGFDDDSGDEIEMGPGASLSLKRRAKTSSKPKKGDNKLAELMGESAQSTGGQPEDDDFFGLSKLRTTQKKQSYQLPTGPAFGDEKEFTKELKDSEIQKDLAYSAKASAAEDDEFDMEPRAEADATKVVEEWKKKKRAEMLRIKLGMKDAEQKPVVFSPEARDGAGKEENAEEGKVLQSVMEQAKQAASEMHSIYSSGMGDYEAASGLSQEELKRQKSAPVEKVDIKAPLMTFAEGSEEEDSEEEDSEDDEPPTVEEVAKTSLLGARGGGAAGGADVEAEVETAAPIEQTAAEDAWAAVEELRRNEARGGDGPNPLGLTRGRLKASGAHATVRYPAALDHFRSADYCRAHVEGTFDVKFDSRPGITPGVMRSNIDGEGQELEEGMQLRARPTADAPFEGASIHRMRQIVVTSGEPKGFLCFGGAKGGKLTFRGGTADRDLVFCMAKCCFDDGREIHARMLQAVNKKLLGISNDVPRYGNHWQDIGFQGSDPTTDLRDAGMLVIMQMLAFVSDHHPIAIKVQQLSENGNRFPVMALSTNWTAVCLSMLRDGKLSSMINKEKDVLEVVNTLFFAQWWDFYSRMLNEPTRIFAEHIAESKKATLKSPSKAVTTFVKAMAKQAAISAEPADFTDMEGAGAAGGGAGF
jgi:hypothetical protein